MDLKDYRVQPDEGLYEKIERRVMRRRMLRVGGVAAAVVLVAAGVWIALSLPSDSRTVALKVGEPSVHEITNAVETRPATSPSETLKKAPEVGETRQAASLQTGKNDGKTSEVGETRPAASLQRDGNGVENQRAAVQQETHERPQVVVEMKPAMEKKEPVAPTTMESPVATEAEGIVAAAEEPQPTAPEKDKAGGTSGTADEFGVLVWAPNVIVPDGDVDANRTFKLKFNATVTDFHVYIYNRGGRQLYTSTESSFEWDGTCKGEKLPQGAYVWVAKFRDSNNKPHQEKGTVTIIR